MQYTEAQQQDLMLLRRLFYGKLGVLARERRECLRRVPLGAAMTDHEVNSRLAEVVATAQELRDITAAEFQTKLQFTSAYQRGVRHTHTHSYMSPLPALPCPAPVLPSSSLIHMLMYVLPSDALFDAANWCCHDKLAA